VGGLDGSFLPRKPMKRALLALSARAREASGVAAASSD
jgi:hypothetical protein